MPVEENKALVHRYTAEVWNQGNLALLDELFALSPQFYGDEHVEALTHLRERTRVYRTAFPDLEVVTDQLLAENDEVMVRWTFRGTHTGPLMGLTPTAVTGSRPDPHFPMRSLPLEVYPTGHHVRFEGVSSFRISEGKICWYWMLMDELDVLRQLGALPLVQSAG